MKNGQQISSLSEPLHASSYSRTNDGRHYNSAPFLNNSGLLLMRAPQVSRDKHGTIYLFTFIMFIFTVTLPPAVVNVTCVACNECCADIWSLLIHVQRAHGVRICQELNDTMPVC